MAAIMKMWLTDEQADWMGYPRNAELYLQSYDLEVNPLSGGVVLTADRRQAMTWATPTMASTAWREPSGLVPLRDDGKPNRPLTAFTVEIEVLP